ncbi:MAG: hypothetical protein ABI366_08560 [Ginsengibacter sp.]
MNVEIRNSFVKDAKKLPPSKRILLEQIIRDIMDKKQLSELTSCKKLTGFKAAFRIRFGSYRIGIFYENETVEFVRVLSRKDIYKYFP